MKNLKKTLSIVRDMVGRTGFRSVSRVVKRAAVFSLLFLLVCSVGFTGAWLTAPEKVSQEQLVAIALPKTVEIRVKVKEGAYVGSGAFVTADGLILTCAHLFSEGHDMIQVRTNDGNVSIAMLVRIDTKHDLGLLKVFGKKPFPYLKIGGDIVRGQKITALGSPLAIQRTVTVGYVENVGLGEDKVNLHSAPINPGNSGGPLLDEYGRLVGVNVATLLVNFFMPAECLEMAVNIEHIKAFLEN